MGGSGKRIEFNGYAVGVAIDATEGSAYDLPYGRLTRSTDIDQIPILLYEQVQAIRFQLAANQRMPLVCRSSRVLRQVLDCLSNALHLHFVFASDRGENVKFCEVEERKQRRGVFGYHDQWRVVVPAPATNSELWLPAPLGSARPPRSCRQGPLGDRPFPLGFSPWGYLPNANTNLLSQKYLYRGWRSKSITAS